MASQGLKYENVISKSDGLQYNVCDSLKMNIYQAKSFLLCPEMWRDICTNHRWEIMISKNIINNNIVAR